MRKLIVILVVFLAGLAVATPVDSYNGLVSAINSATAGSTIKLKAGATITVGAQVNVNKALTISGGWIDDETPGGEKTILSGGGTQDNLKVDAADVTLENIVFTATGAHAIYRSENKGGYLVIRHCDFIDNVCTCERGGIAIYANGTASATLTVEDCVFDNNATTSTADGGYDLHNSSPNGGNRPFGLIVCAKSFKSVSFTSCAFTRNGVDSGHATSGRVGFGDWNPVWGSTLGVWKSPTTLSNCSFQANRGATPHDNNGGGGIVYLAGACDGSKIKNCLFVGNEELCTAKGSVGPNDWAQYNAGALVLNLDSGLKAEVDGCTFAYNLSETSRSAAGLTVQKGAVTIKNSIFYGNRRAPKGVGGADLTVNTDASATVSYSVFTDNTTASVANQNGVALSLGEVGIKYADPLFVSPLSDVTALIIDGTSTLYFDTTKLDDLLALDVHLMSKEGTYSNGEWATYDANSIAIDAGDPDAAYVNEPTPNGDRLNAGAYGNTIQASKSKSAAAAVPKITDATISFPGGYTHPQANVTIGCDDPEADYEAIVTLTLKVNDEVIATQEVPGKHPGSTATCLAPVYLQPGTEVTMEASVRVAGVNPVVLDPPVVTPATGTLPPWYGKGGPANVIHVRAGADGLGTGANWTDALTSFTAALSLLSAEKTEIWVAGDLDVSTSPTALAPTTSIAIRGGFTGTENEASARVAGAVAKLSGGGQVDLLLLNNAQNKTVTLENLEFREAVAHAVRKTGSAGDLIIRNCVFRDNVVAGDLCGAALYLRGTAAAALTLADCVFDNNATTSQSDREWEAEENYGQNDRKPSGLAVRIAQFASVTLTGCTFTRNGVPFDFKTTHNGHMNGYGFGYWNGVYGSTLSVLDAPLTMSGCVFRANRGSTPRAQTTGGGIVMLGGASSGSLIQNCLFVGNEELGNRSEISPSGMAREFAGALVINLNDDATAAVKNCTFAYNTSETAQSAAGLTIRRGIVTVRDVVSYGNRRSANGVGGADLMVNSSATANVSYSVFTADNVASVANENGQALSLGAGIKYGDPLFVTPLSAMTELLTQGPNTTYFDTTRSDDVIAFDVHLQSTQGTYANGVWETYDVDSPAIDAGDPDEAYGSEPTPNGERLNAGCYGNTAEASKSESKEIIVPTIESATITFPSGYTHPQANILLGCETPDADYDATVTVTFKVGGETLVSQKLYGNHPGQTVTYLAPYYLEPGTSITMEVVVDAAGVRAELDNPVVQPAEGVLPPWYGKGGPSNVIHVRAGADGLGTGANWTDALTSFTAALSLLSAEKTEIWVAGDLDVMAAPTALAPTTSIAIRGGFTGTENEASARVAGATASLSGGGQVDLLLLNNAQNKTVTLECLEFREAVAHAVRKTGSAGDLIIRKCVFRDNVTSRDECGVALYLRGNTDKVQSSSLSQVTIEDCLFTNNVTTSVSTEQWELEQYGPNDRKKSGIAVRIAGFKGVTIARCEFIANGVPFGFRQWGGGWQTSQGLGSWSSVYGSTLCAYDAPVTMTGCSFRANRGSTPRAGATGSGVVYIGGASDGSVIEKCLFVGNEELSSARDALGPNEWYAPHESGALVLALNAELSAEVNGCTFAYNLCETSRSAGGLTVHSGHAAIKNSIFYGNKRATKGVGGADLTVKSDATATVTYSVFTGNTCASIANDQGGEAEVLGEGNKFGDALFVSSLSDFESLITTANTSRYFAESVLGDVLALDVHLKSTQGTYVNGAWETYDVDSPAIDAGDPDEAYESEPTPNGDRLNAGFYGNTDEASKSEAAVVIVPTIESVTMTFPDGYTHPQATILLGCATPDADYNATVTVTFKVGGEMIAERAFYGLHKGDTVVYLAPRYVQPGTMVALEVSAKVIGTDPVTCDPVVAPAAGVLPPWYGKGGPSNVIHVRAGADGLGTGENWTDAFPSFSAALAALSNAKDEIWIAGNLTFSSAPTDINPTTSIVIRGGFTGTENEASARVAGAVAKLSGGGLVDVISVNNAAGKTVTFEDLEFREGVRHAVEKKQSPGDVVFRRCLFVDNVMNSHACGQGLAGDGKSRAASLTLEDCVFRKNQSISTTTDPGGDGGPRFDGNVYAYGIAVRLWSFARVTLTRCTFEENGIPLDYRLSGGSSTTGQGLGFWNPVYGSTMFVHDTVLSMTGCSFYANRGSTPRHWSGGGVVYVSGVLDGSEITNCRFVGNEELCSNVSEVTPANFAQWCGALVLAPAANCTTTVRNCTFAYNMSETSKGAGALTVRPTDLIGAPQAVGTVLVRDSVFYGNKRCRNGIGGADFAADDAATIDIAYSRFTDENAVTGADTTDNLSYGNPLFVTTLANAETCIVPETTTTTFYFNKDLPGTFDKVKAFNVHLRGAVGYVDEQTGLRVLFPGENSLAIDAGDPLAAYANEPKPNGRRVNLGCYGNTPYATGTYAKGVAKGLLIQDK